MCGDKVLLETDLPSLKLRARGKVRDIYDLGDALLFIATDRISAFDCILPDGIPCKGRVLTQSSLFWFELLRDMVPSHVLTADVSAYPAAIQPYKETLEGRSMLVKKARMLEVECVARAYLAGSAWTEYRIAGTASGVSLPGGLRESDRLPEPIFTPATKSQTGHDENISFGVLVSSIGQSLAERLRDLTLTLYRRAAAYALERGLILADTKFEFGVIDDELVLADEALTPDSSRYWPADSYRPGGPQPSFDKQFVRDYLQTLAWDKRPPAPRLPDEVIRKTSEKYAEAYLRLTGHSL